MIGTFTELTKTRLLIHENDGHEIRFIDDKTGDVFRKILTTEELEMMKRYIDRALAEKEEA